MLMNDNKIEYKFVYFFKANITLEISKPKDNPNPGLAIEKKTLFFIIMENRTPKNKPIIIPVIMYLECSLFSL